MADEAPQTVPATAPDGTDYDLPIDQVQHAKSLGWQVEDPNESTLSQIGTVAEGIGQGAVPFFPKIEAAVAPQAGSLEAQKARAEANPTESSVGKAIGFGGQALAIGAATGGLGDLAEAGELAPKAGAIAKVLGGAEPAEAITAATATPEALSGAADAAIQVAPTTVDAAQAAAVAKPTAYGAQAAAGGAGNATGYINESELGDSGFNGEALAMQVGLGTILGAAGEGAAHVLGETIAPRIITKTSDALDAVGSKLGSLFYKASDALNGLESGTTEAAGKAIAKGAAKLADSAIDKGADALTDIRNKIHDVDDKLWDTYNPGEAKEMLKDVPAAPVREAVQAIHERLSTNIEAIEARMGVLMSRGVSVGAVGDAVDITKSALKDYAKAIANPKASVYDLQRATVALRRSVDTGAAWGKTLLPGSEQDLMGELRSSVRTPLKNTLNHAGIWGEEMAGRNAAINKTWIGLKAAEKNLMSDLGQKDWSEGMQKEFSISPAKLRQALNGDPLATQLKLKHLHEYVDAAHDYLGEVKTSAGNAGAIMPGGDDLHALLDQVTAQRRAAEAYQPVVNLRKAVASQPPWGLGAGGAAPIAGLAAHALGAGAGIITPLVAGVAAIRAPVKAMQMFAKITSASKLARDAISSGVSKLLTSPATRTAVTAASLRGLTFKSEQKAGAPGRDASDYAKAAHHISALSADTQVQLSALTENTGRLQSVAPQTAMSVGGTSIRALQALNGELLRNPAPSMLASENKNWEPNASDLQQWNDMHAAIMRPPNFLAQLQSGQASPTTWKALRAIYPKWTSAVQQELTDQLTRKTKLDLDPGQKASISMVLGQPVSPTVAPEQIQFQQAIYATPEAQPAAGGPLKSTQSGLGKLDLGKRIAPGHHASL